MKREFSKEYRVTSSDREKIQELFQKSLAACDAYGSLVKTTNTSDFDCLDGEVWGGTNKVRYIFPQQDVSEPVESKTDGMKSKYMSQGVRINSHNFNRAFVEGETEVTYWDNNHTFFLIINTKSEVPQKLLNNLEDVLRA